MPTLPENSVDSVITDPPYGLDFMGKSWDHGVPGIEFWQAALRVAKPGAILMAFGGTRTYHRLTCAIEDAGWELRDTMCWLYGSGFPKSLDISKAIDKAAGAERMLTKPGIIQRDGYGDDWDTGSSESRPRYDLPSTPAAHLWQGWGTALKPAHEDIIVAQKPLDTPTECGIILENLYHLEAQLWSLLDVNTAEKLFKSNRPDYDAVCAFAQWNADEKRSIQEGLCGQMDTLQFASVMTSCLNTVTSWSSTLADALADGKMSTTETESSQTIDLKTLNSCLSALTPNSIIRTAITQPGSWQSALPAARYLSAVVAKLNSTPQRFAAETATARALISQQEEEGLNLTPEYSPIIVAMKPLEGTYAENAQKWGVAGLNIDGGRIGTSTELHVSKPRADRTGFIKGFVSGTETTSRDFGRWPANLLLDEEAARLLDQQSGESQSVASDRNWQESGNDNPVRFKGRNIKSGVHFGDSGGASRFFYTSKASSSERNAGLDDEPKQFLATMGDGIGGREHNPKEPTAWKQNFHPTVKPVSLMRYLCKLTRTPTGGVVLDPFMGSGTTGIACVLEHRDFIGIEIDAKYAEIARKRIADMTGPLFTMQEAA